MKKVFSLWLAVLLFLSSALPAAAADADLDAQLKEITQKTKATLGIGDAYKSFDGNLSNNGINELWYLRWSSEAEELSVTVRSDGKIMEYNRYFYDDNASYKQEFSPSFPRYTENDAKAVAEKFLKTILGSGVETADFSSDMKIFARPDQQSRFYFYGSIKLYSYPSAISFTIAIDMERNAVTNFSRSDAYTKFINAPSAPGTVTSAADAKLLLKDKITLELLYVLDGKANSSRAVLRYVPKYTGNFLVDAVSGKLIDIDKLYEDAKNSYTRDEGLTNGAGASAASPEEKAKLTPEELSGISKLEGVLSQEKLDESARKITEFGLSGYTLNTSRYDQNKEKGEVYCNLSYSKKITAGEVSDETIKKQIASGEYGPVYSYKYVYLNAKTGEILSLSSSAPYLGPVGSVKYGEDSMKAKAETFLSQYAKEEFEKTALYESYDYKSTYNASYTFNYVQNVDSIPFPSNYINISMNAMTGFVDSYYQSDLWDRDIAFDSADGVVSLEQAVANYSDAKGAVLQYASLPVAVDPSNSDLRPLIERGIYYINELRLCYGFDPKKSDISYIDAKTGEAKTYDSYAADNSFTYSDIDKNWAKDKIQKLAKYGIGFPGGVFKPDEKLTQKDMLLLLLTANTAISLPEDEKLAEEQIYNMAYSAGFLKSGEKDAAKQITRAEAVKFLIKITGYGKAAELKGIYKTSFRDASAIPDSYLGYIAIAQGLGIVSGDEQGRFNPNRVITRAEIAAMLYNFMDRNA